MFILFPTVHRKTNFLVNLYWDNNILILILILFNGNILGWTALRSYVKVEVKFAVQSLTVCTVSVDVKQQ